MNCVKKMFEVYPGEIRDDLTKRADCIAACYACAETCNLCADACLAEHHVSPMITCINRNLDCSDVCFATARIISRLTGHERDMVVAILTACSEACRICAGECGRHASQMEHCQICAQNCRRCASACEKLLKSI